MIRETITSLIAGAAGLFSALTILLLIYIAICNVFFNHDGHTEKVFGKISSSKPGKKVPYILPVGMGISLLALNMLIASCMRGGNFIYDTGSVVSLLIKDSALFTMPGIILCIVSMALYIAGSVLFNKVGGEKYSVLFCLNPAACLLVMPYIHSLVALLWAWGYWGFRKKKYWLIAVCLVAGVAVHFPVNRFNVGELIMLGYLTLIPVLAKAHKEDYKKIAVTLAVICGGFAVFSQLIIGFI